MSFRFRRTLAERIAKKIKASSNGSDQIRSLDDDHLVRRLSSALEIRKTSENGPELHLPAIKARNLFNEYGATSIKWIIENNNIDHDRDDRLIAKVHYEEEDAKNSRAGKYVFNIDVDTFVREVLEGHEKDDPQCLNDGKPRKIIVEFSSPNIAKPFHVGHLRSTIIGNFISNLFKFLGHEVVRMNYLGDWGTQLGILKIGIELTQPTEDEMKTKPIETLYRAYVEGNCASKEDENLARRARRIFANLEAGGTQEDIQQWNQFREFTVNELRGMYKRLGVEFDEYAWESQYSQQQVEKILDRLERKSLLSAEDDGRLIVQVGDRRVPVVKSDGTTLYLARDIAALIDRLQRHKFDKIIYVVDNAQTDHFVACFHIAGQLESGLSEKTKHVKFGRIKGMSTRAGNVVFLRDVLDEARDIMMEKQIQSPTTKLDTKNLDNEIADVLGVSAVIVNDLKQRRQRDYDFDWNKALQVNGDTGIKLQYTHCRLCSLFENIPVVPAATINPLLLQEPEAMALIVEISKFPEAIYKCEETLEACALVTYLFRLSNAISKALKSLSVKNEPSAEVQAQRMRLFYISKAILGDGMKILGLKPLEKM